MNTSPYDATPVTPRTYLFVPADRPDRLGKALASGADAVIVDLEDAVAPAAKAAARSALAALLSPRQPVLVRINGAGTEWFDEDLKLCRLPGVAALVFPKAERVEDLSLIATRLSARVPILPLIETAAGLWNVAAIARHSGVQRLIFGSIDFQLDTGIQGEDIELAAVRSQLVLVSRVAGLAAPVDGVTTSIDDIDLIRSETLRARRFGFGGKLCIHPRQVSIVNDSFLPGPDEIAWAQRVIAADAGAQGAAVAVDGRMVDQPVVARAHAILRSARRSEANPR
jgi:citrate lyase subunit beta/citryl-CoA lyase